MTRYAFPFLVLISFLVCSPMYAQSNDPQPDSSTAAGLTGSGSQASQNIQLTAPELIGLQLYQVYNLFGTPTQVYPIRGQQPWMDDVVFFYSNHLYFYWYKDRVWQVRFDKHYKGKFLSLSMGETREQARAVLGKPLDDKGDWDLFQLPEGSTVNPDRGYPVRVRLFYEAGKLSDAYVYRGDF